MVSGPLPGDMDKNELYDKSMMEYDITPFDEIELDVDEMKADVARACYGR